MKPVCLHCEVRKPNSTRGLCRACADTPGVRSMYPPLSNKAHLHGNGLGHVGSYALPPSPTAAPVGSAAKMAVMTKRAILGVSLFHPEDSKEVQPCREERCSTTRRHKSILAPA